MSSPPLALYVHFPWCVSKCPYCDFNSHALRGELPQDRYVEALERDIASQAIRAQGRSIVSVFLGGGTPSLFAPESIGRVLAAARRHLRIDGPVEITMETNPGAIERGRFAEYAAAGVNRVSLGGQSFDAGALRTLGRIHSPEETVKAAEELHAAGLSNFNIDLMYGLPGQDAPGAVSDVKRALELAPAHLSHYQLTLEPGTVFAAMPPALPTDDAAFVMLEQCQDHLSGAGFARYEVSAYAQPARRSTHNLNYWMFGDYLGVGAGAHGKLTTQQGIVRTTRPREPRRYLACDPAGIEEKAVPAVELPFEFMLNALRLAEGFDSSLFEARTGLDWMQVEPRLAALEARGLVRLEPGRCLPGPRGLEFLNESLLVFVPETAKTSGFSVLSTG